MQIKLNTYHHQIFNKYIILVLKKKIIFNNIKNYDYTFFTEKL